jgi:RNA polymerase sigma-70 factor (ECF subfamily)
MGLRRWFMEAEAMMSATEFEGKLHVHYPYVLRVCQRILRDEGLAEDATQETMVNAWLGFKEFREDAEIKTWITRIAVNAALTIIRKRRRVPESALCEVNIDILSDRHLNTSHDMVAGEKEDAMTRAAWELPLMFRSAVILHHFEGLNLDDTAERLGLSVATVKTRLFRGRVKLRKNMLRSSLKRRP